MKAIQVSYRGPTDTRGSGLIAKAEGVSSVTIGYPHELNSDDAHRLAAEKLCDKYGWTHRSADGASSRLVSGGLPNGDTVFCFIPW